MKRSEKMIVGIGMIGVGLGVLIMVGGEQYTNFNNNLTHTSELQNNLATLKTQETGLEAQKAQLQKGVSLPNDIKIISFTSTNKSQVIKQIIDAVVSKAAEYDNTLISIAPQAVEPLIPPPAEGAPVDGSTPPATDGTATPPPATPPTEGATPVDPTAGTIVLGGPAAPALPMVETFGYALQIRGTYDGILSFIKSIAESKDLMELLNIKIENETGESRSEASGGDVALEPSKPIKLTATLRVGIQPAK